MQDIGANDHVIRFLDETLRLWGLVHVKRLEDHAIIEFIQRALCFVKEATGNISVGVRGERRAQSLNDSLRGATGAGAYISVC